MFCSKKHIEIPIPDDEWQCPKCGSKDFNVEAIDGFSSDCELFHSDDYVCCYNCGYGASLKIFITNYMKKKNMVKCECCRGTGWVEKEG